MKADRDFQHTTVCLSESQEHLKQFSERVSWSYSYWCCRHRPRRCRLKKIVSSLCSQPKPTSPLFGVLNVGWDLPKGTSIMRPCIRSPTLCSFVPPPVLICLISDRIHIARKDERSQVLSIWSSPKSAPDSFGTASAASADSFRNSKFTRKKKRSKNETLKPCTALVNSCSRYGSCHDLIELTRSARCGGWWVIGGDRWKTKIELLRPLGGGVQIKTKWKQK